MARLMKWKFSFPKLMYLLMKIHFLSTVPLDIMGNFVFYVSLAMVRQVLDCATNALQAKQYTSSLLYRVSSYWV